MGGRHSELRNSLITVQLKKNIYILVSEKWGSRDPFIFCILNNDLFKSEKTAFAEVLSLL